LGHLDNNKLLDKICERLWIASGSLKGIGSLFTQDQKEICLDSDEFYGIGQLLKTISEELSILEDLIRSGCDSMANKRNGLEEEDEDEKEEDDDDGENMHPECNLPLPDDELFLGQIISILKKELIKNKTKRLKLPKKKTSN